MAMVQRFSIDVSYLHRFKATTAYPALSIVDSSTSKLAAGLAYAFERQSGGKLSNHRAYLSLAYPLGNIAAIGITTKYMRGGGSSIKDFNAFTGDVGLIINPIAGLYVGVVGYNLIENRKDLFLPIMLGAGVGYAHESFTLDFDFVTNLSDKKNPDFRYHLGGEYLIAKMVPIRIGYTKDDDTNTHRWSLGTGFVTKSGAVDVGYRQNAHNPPERELTVALRFFM
jgi:hypothetical protein